MKILLSILIPLTPDRAETVKKLLRHFSLYRYGCITRTKHGNLDIAEYWHPGCEIEIITAEDNKEMTLGEKRECLYKLSSGEYSWQIDSDDDIHEDAVELILKAINDEAPDCITFREKCIINGVVQTSNHSIKYDDWANDFDGYSYTRNAFYKSVIRTDIARSVPFEHIRYGEDHAWSRALKPHLTNEVHIDKELYIYIHNSKPEEHDERYGIK